MKLLLAAEMRKEVEVVKIVNMVPKPNSTVAPAKTSYESDDDLSSSSCVIVNPPPDYVPNRCTTNDAIANTTTKTTVATSTSNTFPFFRDSATCDKQEGSKADDSLRQANDKYNNCPFCKACDNPMYYCHNVLFGQHCINAVRAYCLEAGTRANVQDMYELFLSEYNHAYRIKKSELTHRFVRKTYPIPACMQNDSFQTAHFILHNHNLVQLNYTKKNGTGRLAEGVDDK